MNNVNNDDDDDNNSSGSSISDDDDEYTDSGSSSGSDSSDSDATKRRTARNDDVPEKKAVSKPHPPLAKQKTNRKRSLDSEITRKPGAPAHTSAAPISDANAAVATTTTTRNRTAKPKTKNQNESGGVSDNVKTNATTNVDIKTSGESNKSSTKSAKKSKIKSNSRNNTIKSKNVDASANASDLAHVATDISVRSRIDGGYDDSMDGDIGRKDLKQRSLKDQLTLPAFSHGSLSGRPLARGAFRRNANVRSTSGNNSNNTATVNNYIANADNEGNKIVCGSDATRFSSLVGVTNYDECLRFAASIIVKDTGIHCNISNGTNKSRESVVSAHPQTLSILHADSTAVSSAVNQVAAFLWKYSEAYIFASKCDDARAQNKEFRFDPSQRFTQTIAAYHALYCQARSRCRFGPGCNNCMNHAEWVYRLSSSPKSPEFVSAYWDDSDSRRQDQVTMMLDDITPYTDTSDDASDDASDDENSKATKYAKDSGIAASRPSSTPSMTAAPCSTIYVALRIPLQEQDLLKETSEWEEMPNRDVNGPYTYRDHPRCYLMCCNSAAYIGMGL